jgi:WD40 repeat protein
MSVSADLFELPRNPFPGLRPFQSRESHLFFGRDGQSEQMIEKLADRRFLAIVGVSGSGKSSLLRAGLLPALKGGFMTGAGSNWRIALIRPTNDPIGNLARELNAPHVFGASEAGEAGFRLAFTEATLRLGSRGLIEVARQNRLPAGDNLLIVVDQFEELFRFARAASSDAREERERDQNDAAAFVKLLIEARTQREINLHVVLTMRSDYLGDCTRFWDLPEAVNEGQYLIPRLTRDQLREAISGPIALKGAQITPRLVNRLLNDIGENQDQLPVLQHALMRVWDEWTEKRMEVGGRPHREVHEGEAIDLCCYEAAGEMAQALSRHADEAYNELPDDRHRRIAEKLFKCLTEKGPDNREVRRPATLGEIRAVAEATETEVVRVIEAFRHPGRSFLTPAAGTPLRAQDLIDISHESLARLWTRLKGWVEEESLSASFYRRLVETAESHREGNAALWHDPDLQVALNWREKRKPNETWAQRYHGGYEDAISFLTASRKQRDEESAAIEQRRKEELEAERRRAQEAARSASRLRKLIFAIILGTLATGAASAFAFFTYRKSLETELDRLRLSSVASMNLAQKEKSTNGVRELLDDFFSSSRRQDQRDLRYFAWRCLWRNYHNEKETLRGHEETVRSVAFSPDGLLLASGDDDGKLMLWEVRTAKELARLNAQGKIINSLAFSADGLLLASAESDGRVTLWNVKSRAEARTLTGHEDAVNSVAFSSDRLTLASGGRDGAVKLWNIQTGEAVKTLTGHNDSVHSVAFSPNGLTLASGSLDRTVRLWDAKTGKVEKTLTGHEASVASVAFSPDGRTLASGSADQTLILWDVESGSVLRKLIPEARVTAVAFSPNGRWLASGDRDGIVSLWDVEKEQVLKTLPGHKDSVHSVAFSPDGQMLTSGSSDKTVKLWEPGAGRGEDHHNGGINAVAISLDGLTLASGGADNEVKLWDVKNETVFATLRGNADSVNSVTFSPDGLTLASGSEDGALKLWDVKNRRELAALQDRGKSIRSIAFSPDGRILASADGTARLWDVNTRSVRATLQGDANAVAFSPDGRMLAGGSEDGALRLWEVGSQKEIWSRAGHEHPIRAVSFSSDGQTLASGSLDGTMKLWVVKNGVQRGVLKSDGKAIKSIAFSPDGRVLASGSEDWVVRLWDVQSGISLATLEGHGQAVNSVVFSPGGRMLASGSSDLTVKFWRAATDDEIARQRNK